MCVCQGNTKARIEFDLSRYQDFQLNFTDSQTTGMQQSLLPLTVYYWRLDHVFIEYLAYCISWIEAFAAVVKR